MGPKLFTEMVEIYIKDANRCKWTFLCKHSLRNLMWEKDKAGMEYILANANTVSTVWVDLGWKSENVSK